MPAEGTTQQFHEAWSHVRDVDGWLTEAQARTLFAAAAAVPQDRAIVEIGSHHGKSTIILASAAQHGVPVFAIDPFADERWGGGVPARTRFHENLQRAGVDAKVEAMRMTSTCAADRWDGRPVGLVYLDGAHDEESVLEDIDRWGSMLDNAGRLFIHDCFSSIGVTSAVIRRLAFSLTLAFSGNVGTLAIFEKRRISTRRRVLALIRLMLRTPYFARNLLVKVALRKRWTRLHRLAGHRDCCDPF